MGGVQTSTSGGATTLPGLFAGRRSGRRLPRRQPPLRQRLRPDRHPGLLGPARPPPPSRAALAAAGTEQRLLHRGASSASSGRSARAAGRPSTSCARSSRAWPTSRWASCATDQRSSGRSLGWLRCAAKSSGLGAGAASADNNREWHVVPGAREHGAHARVYRSRRAAADRVAWRPTTVPTIQPPTTPPGSATPWPGSAVRRSC